MSPLTIILLIIFGLLLLATLYLMIAALFNLPPLNVPVVPLPPPPPPSPPSPPVDPIPTPVPPIDPTPTPVSFEELPGVDLLKSGRAVAVGSDGNPLREGEPLPTFSNCREMCENDADCMAFTFTNFYQDFTENATGFCHKIIVGPIVRNTSRRTYSGIKQ